MINKSNVTFSFFDAPHKKTKYCRLKVITRSILILSLVSLLTDISSEMLYPIMPLYLKSIGYTVIFIGVLEGVAEAIAGISKGYFGKLSDVTGKRVTFIRSGYLMSAVTKPILGLLISPFWIFFSRALDRLGKGVRTSARDALLSDESSPETRGKVFGFHRAMDTLGAAIGPVIALIYLHYFPGNYAPMFLIAFIPATAGVLFTLFLKEKKSTALHIKGKTNFFSFLNYIKSASPDYKRLVTGLFAFTLFNSSDAFLLLSIKNSGYGDNDVLMIYIFYNLVFALSSFPIGMLADRFGMKKSYVFGLIMFCLVYGSLAFKPGIEFLFVIFFAYGIYAAATEGVSKAWITKICRKEDTATAIGFYTGLNSVFTIAASSAAGFIWYAFGPEVMFAFSSAGVLLVIVYFILFFRKEISHQGSLS